MPTDRQTPDADLPLDPEFARVLRMSDPGMALDGPLTFVPPLGASPEGWRQAWRAWLAGTLALTIAPCLAAAAAYAERNAARELQTLDLELDAGLEETARARTRAAGRRLLRRLANARGERWLDRFQALAAREATPAHFPVVFAGQSALFHLSRRLLLPGYAYWEWCAAMSARPPVGGRRPVFARELDGLLPSVADTAPSSDPSSLVFHAANLQPSVQGAS